MKKEDKIKYNMVVYLDGSALNVDPTGRNPYGSGAHGYFYKETDIDKKTNNKPSRWVITDQGYLEQEQLARYIYKLVTPSNYFNLAASYLGRGTNNMGELLALIETLNIVLDTEFLVTKITYKTDSMYVLNIMNNIIKDKDRNWYSADRVNIDLWVDLEKVYHKCIESGIEIVGVKVKGHSGILGNDIADRLAFLGRYKSSMDKPGIVYDIRPAMHYWKPKVEKHPLINFRHLFFSSEQRRNAIAPLYTVMDYKKDVEVGRKTNEAMFGVIKLKKPVQEIEDIMNFHSNYMSTLSMLSTVDLATVYSQKHVLYKEIFGDDIYTINTRNRNMTVLEEDVIANNVLPAGLATQAMSKTSNLYNILEEYQSNPSNNDYRTFKDITDIIFGLDGKKKPIILLDSIIKVLKVSVKENGIETDIMLELGKDIINRNALKKLEKLEPKITLVIDKVSDKQLDYYTIIEIGKTEDIGIYTNYYSNKVFIKNKDK